MNLFGKRICQQNYPFYIAEISCNHNGSLDQAKELILAARDAGADAVKIQCYEPDEMTLPYSIYDSRTFPDDFRIKNGPWKDKYLHDLYREAHTSREMVAELFSFARSHNINIFASVFSDVGLQFLESIKCEAYKIASFEFNDTPLIRKVARTGKPLIMSVSATAPIDHVERALSITTPINTALLHCVASYPTKEDQANLYRIEVLRSFYGVPVGFSDHSVGSIVTPIAVAMGARIIEKHITLPGLNTEDSEFSITPSEFKIMVAKCNNVVSMINKSYVDPELDSKQFRRSLYIIKDIQEGEAFTLENVKSIRPSYGLDPDKLYQVITKRAKNDLKRGTALTMEMIS